MITLILFIVGMISVGSTLTFKAIVTRNGQTFETWEWVPCAITANALAVMFISLAFGLGALIYHFPWPVFGLVSGVGLTIGIYKGIKKVLALPKAEVKELPKKDAPARRSIYDIIEG